MSVFESLRGIPARRQDGGPLRSLYHRPAGLFATRRFIELRGCLR
ncbi:hypothetical protein SAMN04490203_2349 [Pseudomonas taetrolens]|uniref:Uncharacterized protein n=1 Tax=Pseudomonas taetrolens TaxID=47884 RepID=A0A1H4S8L1_PSETA|nr:hypothetical protein [Pseudomonas taetrolens]SEC40407.1 hypothetical protein SAMN04490203_2349 [Pseudomonas taetrolens]SQF86501.1 Uncharacterised protein [Pseudomonas taetrolens]VEH49578.1 Uncharacterised protein [Pseudomonas taetrolens]